MINCSAQSVNQDMDWTKHEEPAQNAMQTRMSGVMEKDHALMDQLAVL